MEATTTESETKKDSPVDVACFGSACGLCKESFEEPPPENSENEKNAEENEKQAPCPHAKDPQLLPCLHSLCKSCLRNHSQDSGTEDQVNACPVCKQKYAPQDVIENRFMVEQLNSRVTKPEEDKDHICTGCDENIIASSYCNVCSEWLCDTCVQAHRRVKITKDHTIEPKETAQVNAGASATEKAFPRCPVHEKELLKLYCETCEVLTCRDCQLEDHKDHKYNFIEDHGEKYKEFMKDMLKRIAEKRAYIENAKVLINKRFTDIKEKEQVVGNSIKKFAIEFITDINRRGKALLADLNAVCQAKKNQLNQKNKEILNLSTRLDHAMLFTEQALNAGSSQALLYSKKTLTKQLLTVLRTRCEVPNPNHQIDIKFQYDSQTLKSQIPNLGRLQVDGIHYSGPSYSQQIMRTMQLGSPTSHSINFQSLPPEQRNAMLLRMTAQSRANLLATSPAGSPTGTSPSLPRLPPASMTLSGGRTVVHQKQLGKTSSQARAPNQRPILPKPHAATATASRAVAVNSQPQISSSTGTSTPQSSTVPTLGTMTNMSYTAAPSSDNSGTSPSSSTGADNTRPSSSDSARGSGTTPAIDLNPRTFSFDADPASLANISIKKEVGNNEAENLNQSHSPPQSPGSTNHEGYSLNDPITDQAIGFQQQPTCMPESNDPNEDYCACCHNGGDLLCCDTCPMVFHLKCHVPELGTAPVGNWSCGLCVPNEELVVQESDGRPDLPFGERKRKMNVGLSEKEMKMCERILLQLFCHPASPPFHEPVSKAIPNYHKIITNPMDFTTIRCKLMTKHFNHYVSLDDFVTDVRLVFINCAKYNTEYSEVGKAGRDVEKFFEGLLKLFAPWYEYTYSHQVRDTSTPKSDKSDNSTRPPKRKKTPDEVVHVV